MKPGDGETRRTDPERAIREAVEAAHRADAPPPFERLWRAGAGGRRRRAWLGLAAGAAAAAAAVLVAVRVGPGRSDRPAPDLPRWTSPTDFLLEVPGLDFLKTAPALRPPAVPVAGDQVADPRKGVLP
jgi:hypothetical protein